MTQLYDAIMDNNIERVRALIDAGADINEPNGMTKDHQYYTPLMAASVHPRHIDILKLLIHAGADLNKTTDKWKIRTALFRALASENLEAFEALLIAGACPNDFGADNNSLPLIHWAADDANPEFLRLLIEYKADLNRTYGNEKSVLLKAIGSRREENIRMLMEQGCRLGKAERWEAKLMGLTDFIQACQQAIKMSRAVESIPLTAPTSQKLRM